MKYRSLDDDQSTKVQSRVSTTAAISRDTLIQQMQQTYNFGVVREVNASFAVRTMVNATTHLIPNVTFWGSVSFLFLA
jgi:hypothetical protein